MAVFPLGLVSNSQAELLASRKREKQFTELECMFGFITLTVSSLFSGKPLRKVSLPTQLNKTY